MELNFPMMLKHSGPTQIPLSKTTNPEVSICRGYAIT